MKRYLCLPLMMGLIVLPFMTIGQGVYISEICPDNANILADENGEFSDLIELHNNGDVTISLEGYSLSDDYDAPAKWTFPNVTIGPDEYLVIIADDQDIIGPYLHTSFKLSKSGEELILSDTGMNVIDSVSFPTVPEDLSYSKLDSGWGITEPTMGLENTSQILHELDIPQFSQTSGIYAQPLTIEITSDVGSTILYTTNGKEPNQESETYTEPIELHASACICVKSMKNGYLDSDYACNTYLIDAEHELDIISICTDPDLLYDEEDGLFQLGPDAEEDWPFWGANFWKDKEIPVHIEYLKDDTSILKGFYGFQMHGGRESRTAPQKTFRLLAREKYTTTYFEYPFFSDKPEINKFKRLVLRNASGDFNQAHFRDGFAQSHIMRNGLDIDQNAYEAVVVYINGEYYGVMGLREKLDKHYIDSNIGLDDDEFDLLEEDAVVIEGDSVQFLTDYDWVISQDLESNDLFELAEAKFDIASFTDYFISQTGLNSTAWPNNNIKYWREKGDSGKWRYLLFDMDVSLGRHSWTDYDVDAFGQKMQLLENKHIQLFLSFLRNTTYKNYFLNRHQDVFNTVFETVYFTESLNELVDELSEEMKQHYDRWTSKDYDTWDNVRVERIRNYMQQRPLYARSYLQDYFDISDTYLLSVEHEKQNGQVMLNTLELSQSEFSGYYFCDIPITLRAEPETGYHFSHWKITTETEQELVYTSTLHRSFCSEVSIEAIFEQGAISNEVVINHVLGTDFLSIEWGQLVQGDLNVRIIDAMGKLILVEEIPSTLGELRLPLRLGAFGLYAVQVYMEDQLLAQKKIVFAQ